MNTHDYIANFIQLTYKYDKTEGFLARFFYLTPAQRIQRLNSIFDTDDFWESTPHDEPVHIKLGEENEFSHHAEQPNEQA
ncbi:hypothetical protein [Vibrio nomapromontoriensis]|uniref:hypothetical protein n=1 Tax=Vibrio nomapromontoriensis TaxID=2910246 RepID=UPI003D09F772